MWLAELLDKHGVLYQSEAIFLNGDRHILADFFIPSAILVIEVDGAAHDDQKRYDAGRDRWLLDRYGVRTLRLPNNTVLRNPNDAVSFVKEALK